MSSKGPVTTAPGLSEGNPETQRAFAVEGIVRPLLALLCHGGKRMMVSRGT